MARMILIYFLLIGISAIAQDGNTNGPWKADGSFASDGVQRLKTLEEHTRTLRSTDPDSSLAVSRILLSEARVARDTFMIGSGYRNLGIAVFLSGEGSEAALAALDSALVYFETRNDSAHLQGMGLTLSNIAYMNINMGRYDKALEFCHRSLPYLRSSGDNNAMLSVYNDLGQSHKAHGRTDSAVYYFEKLINKAEELGQDQQVIWGYNNLSIVHAGLGLLPEALDNAYRSLSILENIGSDEQIVNALFVLRDIKVMLGEYDGALDLMDRAMELCRKNSDTTCMAGTYGGIGSTLLEMGKLDTAMVMLELALKLKRDPNSNDKHELSMLSKTYRLQGRLDDALIILEELHADAREKGILEDEVWILQEKGLISSHKKRFGQAITYCQESLAKAEQAGLLPAQQDAYECLYQIHKQRRDGMQALAYLEKANEIRNNILSEKAQRQAAQREFQREHEKQKLRDSLEHANALLELEHERTIAMIRADQNADRAMATGIGAVLLLGGGGISFIADRRRRRERFDKEVATLETQALRSQMNPHFIFNALNSINAFIQRNDPDHASSYLTKFARVMRLVLENSRHAEVPLEDDLEALKGYMDLERMRMQNRFEHSIEVDPSIDPSAVVVPPLVVQPFIENAIWHGMNGVERNGVIRLKVGKKDGQLVLTVEDNGVGRNKKKVAPPPGVPVKKTSLGTAITRARLDLIQKQHGGNAGFKYTDLAEGTRVEVTMPLMMA